MARERLEPPVPPTNDKKQENHEFKTTGSSKQIGRQTIESTIFGLSEDKNEQLRKILSMKRKRAKSLLPRENAKNYNRDQNTSGDSDARSGREQPISNVENSSILIRRGLQRGCSGKIRSYSEETRVSASIRASELAELIERQEKSGSNADENLTALAKVLLNEHKRSMLQMRQMITEESSISFNSPDFGSKRDSFSSRQDSSISQVIFMSILFTT